MHRSCGNDVESVTDSGIKISARAEKILKLVVYYIKLQDRLSCAIGVSD